MVVRHGTGCMVRPGGARERGSVLLAVALLTVGLASTTTALIASTRALALEHRARLEVTCARYAALSGLALAEPTPVGSVRRHRLGSGSNNSEAFVSMRVTSSGACLLQSEGRCGSARYPVERVVASRPWCA